MTRTGRKRRVFLWVFLAIQAGFVIFLAVGLSGKTPDTHAQALSLCSHGQWSPLYASHTQCVSQGGKSLAAASDVGTTIGAGLVVILWCIVDFLLAVIYGIYRLARKPS
jgi:hypothetical protein